MHNPRQSPLFKHTPRIAWLLLPALAALSAHADAIPPAATVIAAEVSKAGNDPAGRPLPLASSWDSGMGAWGLTGYPHYLPREEVKGRLTLQRQREMIEAGHHWLPVLPFPSQALTKAQDPEGSPWFNFAGHFEPWDAFAAWGLPVTFAQTQFESPLYNQSGTTDRWVKLPPSQNPNYIRADKVFRKGVLAAGAIATTAGSPTVRVTLPDASGVDASPRSRIWITQPVLVGGLQMSGERWQLTAVEGNEVSFTHASPATETAAGGGVSFEVALVESVADPLGPIGPWREAGAWWLKEHSGVKEAVSGWKNLQARYPKPSRLIFLSNNEGRMMSASQRNESRRYVDAHGDGTTEPFGNEIFAKGYAERFRALFAGMRAAMPEAWASASRMIAYNAVFSWQYGRDGGWGRRLFPNGLNYEKNTWDGASPEYYLNPWQGGSTDYTVFSPQVEFMNTKWQLDLVYKTHPDFWYEMSVWDGFLPNEPDAAKNKRAWYASKNDPFTPERYKAWLQYGMWLTRPRVVREYRNTGCPLEETGMAYFLKFLEAVDDVHADPLKTRFWRHGTVVANTSRPHPYGVSTLPEYESIPKWFNLSTDLDRFPPPGRSVDLATEIPVWALASVIGAAPRREWLVYAYSPRQDRKGVAITIPGYRDVVLDVPRAGVFHHVVETE